MYACCMREPIPLPGLHARMDRAGLSAPETKLDRQSAKGRGGLDLCAPNPGLTGGTGTVERRKTRLRRERYLGGPGIPLLSPGNQ